ncbi:MAG: sn-glycerol-3-phosphate ABC transporter ATP-binding protein UgpC [Bacteroidetes bacterium]|nr:sn-glycerol-3-phosphate ABC transporter ATP-binding protein UgpC [Bacteroidota bacterium]
MAHLVLERVSKVYASGQVAVREVSFEVQDREFVVLVGPSGCGKTTLLRMIAGLEEITSGNLYIDGVRVNDVPPKARDIAMVFQSYALYPHMSVYENMAFGLRLRRLPKEEIERRVQAAAAMLGLAELLHRKPRELSGGQRQRVALGRAIVRRPKVFLFDEPLSNLDAQMRVQTRAELLRLHRELEATILYVTHDQVEAMTMGDRIVVLNRGEIQQIDTPMRLYRYPANLFVAGFIGSPPMNLFTGRLRKEQGWIFESDAGPLRVRLPEAMTLSDPPERVVLGVRPEHWGLSEEARSEGALAGLVEMCELTGSEALLYVRTEAGRITLRTTSERDVEPGQIVWLWPDPEHLHLFAAATGKALGHGGRREAA